MTELMEWFKELGPLGGVLFLIWLFGSKTGKFLAPKFTELLDTHCDMMVGLTAQAERQTDLMEVQVNATQNNTRKIDEIHRVIVPEDE
tara:strand:+ start:208 stop:471 length:264 start_codon:yes stop_codon:yes gene_type:complete